MVRYKQDKQPIPSIPQDQTLWIEHNARQLLELKVQRKPRVQRQAKSLATTWPSVFCHYMSKLRRLQVNMNRHQKKKITMIMAVTEIPLTTLIGSHRVTKTMRRVSKTQRRLLTATIALLCTQDTLTTTWSKKYLSSTLSSIWPRGRTPHLISVGSTGQ